MTTPFRENQCYASIGVAYARTTASLFAHTTDNGLRDRMTTILDQIRTFCLVDENADRLLDWMAHMLQFPYIKPQRGIVLAGPPHCGKTSFARFLTLLLGGMIAVVQRSGGASGLARLATRYTTQPSHVLLDFVAA